MKTCNMRCGFNNNNPQCEYPVCVVIRNVENNRKFHSLHMFNTMRIDWGNGLKTENGKVVLEFSPLSNE